MRGANTDTAYAAQRRKNFERPEVGKLACRLQAEEKTEQRSKAQAGVMSESARRMR